MSRQLYFLSSNTSNSQTVTPTSILHSIHHYQYLLLLLLVLVLNSYHYFKVLKYLYKEVERTLKECLHLSKLY